MQTLRKLARLIWALPVFVITLMCWLPFFWCPIRLDGGALVTVVRGFPGRFMASRHWGGITLGVLIVLWKHDNPAVLNHERVHVRQWLHWGILFPFIYGYQLIRYGYRRAPFEVAAYGVNHDSSASHAAHSTPPGSGAPHIGHS